MTSIPASRRARAITFAPRSCPSSPGLATNTRIFFSAIGFSLYSPRRTARSLFEPTKGTAKGRRCFNETVSVCCGCGPADEIEQDRIEMIGIVHEERVADAVEDLYLRVRNLFLYCDHVIGIAGFRRNDECGLIEFR